MSSRNIYDQRNSIKRFDIAGTRTITSFRVFPPFPAALEDTPLGKAALGRDIVTDFDRLEKLIAAIETASTAELDMARAVLHFHVEELQDFVRDTSWMARDLLKLNKGPAAMVRNILDGVSKDVRTTFDAVDGAPRHQDHQHVLRGTMGYLAEVLALANAASPAFGAEFEQLTKKASDNYVRYSKWIRKMASELEPRYAGIIERVGDHDKMLREADARVREMDMTVPDVSAQTLNALLSDLGDKDHLWDVFRSEKRMKHAIEKGWYRAYSEADADEVRQRACKLFRDVNRAYNTGGIVAELMMAASAIRFTGSSQIDGADKYTVQEVRRTKKGLYDSKQEHEERIDQLVQEVPDRRFAARADGAYYLAMANLIGDFLNDVHVILHPEMALSKIRFERFADGILVGDLPGVDDTVVISRDRSTSTPDAVYLSRVPKSEIGGEFDSARAKEFPGTSFFSVDEALHDLGSEMLRDWLFDGLRIDGHNGFDVLAAERRSIRKKLAAGARITDFAEYDGKTALSV